jgi:hypothetical protein
VVEKVILSAHVQTTGSDTNAESGPDCITPQIIWGIAIDEISTVDGDALSRDNNSAVGHNDPLTVSSDFDRLSGSVTDVDADLTRNGTFQNLYLEDNISLVNTNTGEATIRFTANDPGGVFITGGDQAAANRSRLAKKPQYKNR